VHDLADGRLELALVTRSGPDEWLFRIAEIRAGAEERRLAARHGLTDREAEVLLWISRGKANREISEILGISPRTVNKHLEQVFEKMGIENRASAAEILGLSRQSLYVKLRRYGLGDLTAESDG